MFESEARQRLDRGDELMRVAARERADRVTHVHMIAEPTAQPAVEDVIERCRRLHGVENLCAGVDVRLDRVAANQGLAEGVNGGGGELIELRRRIEERDALRRAQSVRQRELQRVRYSTG